MKTSRRDFLTSAGALVLMASGCRHVTPRPKRPLVNDVQSGLNATYVDQVASVRSQSQLESATKQAAKRGKPISICGGRHAMGAQQFLTDGVLIDTTSLRRVLSFDADRGTIEVESGIQWPSLLTYLLSKQRDPERTWTFAQKQTGANRLSLGGALGSNIHGRGLKMKPIVSDIESFTLMDAAGTLRKCDRTENRELFQLAIGGYGLFGVVYTITLRLVPRRKLQRVVEMLNVEKLMPAFARRIEDGFLYGDFQFAIDARSDDFLKRGIFSCYRPVPLDTPIPAQKQLSTSNWLDLVHGAHVQPTRAFEEYSRYYRSTSGNIYWSDLHQFSGYADDFHEVVDQRMRAEHRASEIITEIYVSRLARQLHGRRTRGFPEEPSHCDLRHNSPHRT